MQRVAPVNRLTTLIARSNRRAYAAAAAAAEGTRSSAGTSGVVDPGVMKVAKAAESPGGKPEIFWMRDPKTGNWIPENRFGEVDAAELRQLLLSKK
ncbi:hypothetical protein Taro_025680 [Colocasia esculenta]|uniref:Uncharacterized protein n=1 Tax=Colocasia esculenta TaxID=4460 RepID=A0A843VIB6_COLES|nr:hypothetical protein [Colocasia esculenta]